MFIMHPVSSSLIEAVGYDATKRELHVILFGKGRYVYFEVEKHVFEALLEANSKGAYFNKHIQYSHRFENQTSRDA